MNEIICHSYEDTLRIGNKLGSLLKGKEIIGLIGELGSGKTAFVKGIASSIGYKGYVKSPTFTIINQYKTERINLIHLDIYRLNSFEELLLTGFESYFSDDSVIVIEWFDKFIELFKYPHIRIYFEYIDTNIRKLKVETDSREYINLIDQL